MKFVCVTASKAECELHRPQKGKMKCFNSDGSEVPPMNPPEIRPDPFAPKLKVKKEPVRVASPVASSIRGQVVEKPITNADIMAMLLKLANK